MKKLMKTKNLIETITIIMYHMYIRFTTQLKCYMLSIMLLTSPYFGNIYF